MQSFNIKPFSIDDESDQDQRINTEEVEDFDEYLIIKTDFVK